MTAKELAILIVKYVAANLVQESSSLSPEPQVFMENPYGLLELLETEGILTVDEIDTVFQETKREKDQ